MCIAEPKFFVVIPLGLPTYKSTSLAGIHRGSRYRCPITLVLEGPNRVTFGHDKAARLIIFFKVYDSYCLNLICS